jgi:hypothetical protein
MAPAMRAWVRMPSGKRLDLLNPTPFDWDDADLALGLARTYRWGGHTAWPLPLSVAQHSISVMLLRRAAASASSSASGSASVPGSASASGFATASALTSALATPLAPVIELRELLHDAEEGLLGFDAVSPLKPFLGDGFRDLTRRLEQAVFLRYGLPAWTPAEHERHKRADRLAAASEAVHVAGWSAKEVRDTLRIRAAVLQEDPLAAVYGCRPWEPWPPTLAAERFLAELEALKRRIDEQE